MILPQRGLLVPEIDIKKQLKLLRTRREVERLLCRSAAKSSTPDEREAFTRLAAGFKKAAMRLMYGFSRRFWYYHYKQAGDLPEMASLHGAVAMAIADGDVAGAGTAVDKLLDEIEDFTRATIMEV